MRTDYIDIVHLHSCDINILKLGEVIEALNKTVEQGKVRTAAYSGENDELKFAVESGSFGSIQTSVNICDQIDLDGSIIEAKKKGMGIIAKRPIANAPWKYDKIPSGKYVEDYWIRWKEMNLPEQENWLDTFLRFTVFSEGIDSAIVGTANIDHIKTNIKIIERGPLQNDLYQLIRSKFNPAWRGEV
jgi:aryl-alcohol dehydrogenase-like predicted oxidoreductase